MMFWPRLKKRKMKYNRSFFLQRLSSFYPKGTILAANIFMIFFFFLSFVNKVGNTLLNVITGNIPS